MRPRRKPRLSAVRLALRDRRRRCQLSNWWNTLAITFQPPSVLSKVRLVANGVGVALVPQTAAYRRWPAAVRAIDLGPHTFHRDIGLVHRPDASLSAPARLLAHLIGGLGQLAS